MNRYLYLLLIFALTFIFSCSDDNSTNTTTSDLKGTWRGEHIADYDTARYECNINESKGKISGNGELYGYRKVFDGSRVITDESRLKTSVQGEFNNPDVQIKFNGSTNHHFVGQLSEDKMSINGKVTIYFEFLNSEIDYPITLFRK